MLSVLHSTLPNREVILGELVYAMELLSLLCQSHRKCHDLKTMSLLFSESLTWKWLGEQLQHCVSENHSTGNRPGAVGKLQASCGVCAVAGQTHHPRVTTHRKMSGLNRCCPALRLH